VTQDAPIERHAPPPATPYINLVPGQRAWNSATKYGKKVCIFGDSHLRHVKRNLINQSLTNASADLHWDSGMKTGRLSKYADIVLAEEKPDLVVISIGTNDIHETCNPDYIANEIINVGILSKKHGVKKVFITAVLPRKSFKLRKLINQVNDILIGLCHVHDFVFIKHQANITLKHLNEGGKHLNHDGVRLFASNIVDCVNYFIQISGKTNSNQNK